MEIKEDKSFSEAWKRIPRELIPLADKIRSLIFSSARELELDYLSLTTKWGEASFVSSKGVTIRLAAYKHQQGALGVFFPCSSTMIQNCKELFPEEFEYEKQRAIILSKEGKLNTLTLELVIRAALNYHRVKQEPNLGMAV